MEAQQSSVVVCEAYETLREGLELILRNLYRVTAVNHVADLFPILEDGRPDLLIFDVDGQPEPYEALARVRQFHQTLRILLIAGEFSFDQQIAAVRLSNVSFLTKPFSVEHFLEKVQTLIQGYSGSPKRYVVQIAV